MSTMTHNTYLNMCWPNAYNAIEDSKWLWTCVDLIIPCQWEHKQHLNICCQTPPRLRGYNMHHNMCYRISLLPTKTQNLSQHVFILPRSCQRDQQRFSTRVDQTPPISRISIWVVKTIMCWPCHPGNKMHLNSRWETPPMPAWTRNASQLVLVHASLDKICTSTSVDLPNLEKCFIKCPHRPAVKQNLSQHVLTKSLHFQRGQIMHFNNCCQIPAIRAISHYVSWLQLTIPPLWHCGPKILLYMCF